MPKKFEIIVPVAFEVTVSDDQVEEYIDGEVDVHDLITAVDHTVVETLSLYDGFDVCRSVDVHVDGAGDGFRVSISEDDRQRWCREDQAGMANTPWD